MHTTPSTALPHGLVDSQRSTRHTQTPTHTPHSLPGAATPRVPSSIKGNCLSLFQVLIHLFLLVILLMAGQGQTNGPGVRRSWRRLSSPCSRFPTSAGPLQHLACTWARAGTRRRHHNETSTIRFDLVNMGRDVGLFSCAFVYFT